MCIGFLCRSGGSDLESRTSGCRAPCSGHRGPTQPSSGSPWTSLQPFGREGVQHKREVKPALPASDVGDVRHPEAIWRLWGEVAFHEIGDFDEVFFGSSPASSTSTSLSSTTSEKTWLAHQSSNPFSSAPKAEDPQLAKWMRGAP